MIAMWLNENIIYRMFRGCSNKNYMLQGGKNSP